MLKEFSPQSALYSIQENLLEAYLELQSINEVQMLLAKYDSECCYFWTVHLNHLKVSFRRFVSPIDTLCRPELFQVSFSQKHFKVTF